MGRGEPVVDIVAEDMPEGALPSDEEDKAGHENDPHRLLNFELETVLVRKNKKLGYNMTICPMTLFPIHLICWLNNPTMN